MLKKILMLPLSFMESLADRAISAAGALLFMQIPAFMVQYMQRLGGHVDELKLLVGKYKAAAADNGRTLDEFIQLHIQSGVKEFAATGNIMTENLNRFNILNDALQRISDASGIKKFFVFIQKIDMDIFKAAYKNFTPGISISTDSVIYAAAGIAVFMCIYLTLKKLFSFIFKRFVLKKN